MNASVVSGGRSYSRLSLRSKDSHAKLRSTTQRFLITPKPRCPRKVLICSSVSSWPFGSQYPRVLASERCEGLHGVTESRVDPAFPLAFVSTVGKKVELHLGLVLTQLLQELLAAFSVGDVCGQNLDPEQEAQGINDQMMCSSVDVLATVVTSDPPFCEVFTRLESTIPALGTAFLPSASRT